MDHTRAWLDRTRTLYVLVALVLAAAGWWVTTRADGGDRGERPTSEPVQVRTVAAAPVRVTVHVAGAVRRPGVYVLPEGARAVTALRRAGGPRRDADLGALNLAAPVADGEQLLVPLRGAPGRASGGVGERPTGPVSLNRASAEELEALDGIGPTLAARIVEWRERNGPVGAVDDLLEVPGIGETRLDALREQVVP